MNNVATLPTAEEKGLLSFLEEEVKTSSMRSNDKSSIAILLSTGVIGVELALRMFLGNFPTNAEDLTISIMNNSAYNRISSMTNTSLAVGIPTEASHMTEQRRDVQTNAHQEDIILSPPLINEFTVLKELDFDYGYTLEDADYEIRIVYDGDENIELASFDVKSENKLIDDVDFPDYA